ncbi:hypothetical protein CFP65_2967 [Kitasatospora sp. MMS16-BH015]|uniref:DUF2304 domain-containing protein n=1 Tax=Kitasatospora sp. MMS16-BH015 TaxID=2018025 RepID=UPI000CA22616|nr:DUF2304 domain-containing protein [Kitasatospora sp. MMS16-BH015]AUG77777.1 hypothetical protein CFP65_2967 [Kitasatospora sp. MMS16-BH015]
MQLSFLTSITGIVVLAYILELLRRQQLREKYAAIWLSIGLVIAPLGFVPHLLDSTARRLGVASGVSLVLFAGFVLVLLVSLHLSWEASRLEAETRTLAEDVALIRAHLAEQGMPLDGGRQRSSADSTPEHSS